MFGFKQGTLEATNSTGIEEHITTIIGKSIAIIVIHSKQILEVPAIKQLGKA
jgi:hypothetical protein